jgi:predicted dienelactone hydrolase
MHARRLFWATAGLWALGLCASAAHADMGLAQIDATAQDGPVTLYYPSSSKAQNVARGRLSLWVAEGGLPQRGNGRLIVVSHGSGASPWVHADLAQRLVQAGFVVALPEHRDDNYRESSRPGPDSWAQRPAEVSRAIDAVAQDPRFAPLLMLDKVGVYGMSAGGHTALSLAGGRWSRAGFNSHCQTHLTEDFQTCVGLITQLTGGPLDGIKKWLARTVIGWKFADSTVHQHSDPRIAAVVAGVPAAAHFDMASLATPTVPLALISAQQDRWLIPRFHSDRVLQACLPRCEHLIDLPNAGHGALLSPLPPGFTGLEAALLNDPPGFERAQMAEVDNQTTAFFARHLLN